MVREQGHITGANFISPQAPGSLGLIADIFHLEGGFTSAKQLRKFASNTII